MRDGKILKFLDNRVAAEQRIVLGLRQEGFRREFARQPRQIGQNTERLHISFEVPQFVIDLPIAMLLGGVHMIQLVQNDVKGFREAVKTDNFLSGGVAGALDSKIRVDQKQGFRGEVVQLQIPGRVIRGNVPDHRHVEAIKAEVGVIIVQIGNAFFFAFFAAVFADVVTGRRTRNQAQIQRDPQSRELPGGMHGDIMDSRDVTERIEGCQLCAKTHKFINIVFTCHAEQLCVFAASAVQFAFLLCEKREVERRIKRQGLALKSVQSLEKLQQKQAGGRLLRSFHDTGGFFRKNAPENLPVGMLQPAVRRRRAEAI